MQLTIILLEILAKLAITNGNGDFSIEDITIDKPERDEVVVKIKAEGLRHTDYDPLNWGRPVILGHESAGIVTDKGPDVTSVN